jgi:hypothetical protein
VLCIAGGWGARTAAVASLVRPAIELEIPVGRSQEISRVAVRRRIIDNAQLSVSSGVKPQAEISP